MILRAALVPGLLVLGGCMAPEGAARGPSTGVTSGAAASQIDVIFAEQGCRMTTSALDSALSGRPDAPALERAMEQMLLRGELTLAVARPASVVTSHREGC